MQITVYLDIIFVINFIADFFVLFLTGKILRQKILWWRLIAGAAFGAGILLFFVLMPGLLNGPVGILGCIGVSMGAVAISYGRRQGGLIRKWFLSTTMMILIGSLMNYLRYLLGATVLQLAKWLLLFMFSSIIIFVLLHCLYRTASQTQNIYLILVKHGERMAVDQVYMDTGNFLWDPLFEKPVILLSERFIESLLTQEEMEIIQRYRESGKLDYAALPLGALQQKDCFHEITYESVGESSGKLLCLLLEEIDIQGGGNTLKRQPVAIAPARLFEGKIYQGLLHRECI
ncbi:MAG: sigma-E processing peptidase SpoIIGA [Clostridium sp.]|nr:sigma-E processing peptidase SpoIIGA [Clostridium sp.]